MGSHKSRFTQKSWKKSPNNLGKVRYEISHEKTGDDVYHEWFNKQTDEYKKQLIENGLIPLSDGKVESSYIFDVKETHTAFSFTENKDFDQPAEPKRLYDQDEVEQVVRRVVMAMQLSESPEVLFQARCILIAFGIGDPPTETELSRLKGCSRQFVSKKVKRIQQLFNLSPSQYMRSENACKAYAKAWRKANGLAEEGEGDGGAGTKQ
jgi:hypothetical protein